MDVEKRPRRGARRATARAVLARDDGMTSLEIAVLFPVVLILIFGIGQAAMWYFARSAALAAAQEGVSAGRAYGASPGTGQAAAYAFLRAQVGDVLSGPNVSVDSSGAGTVRITVSGNSLSLVPGWTITVSQTAQGPAETFQP